VEGNGGTNDKSMWEGQIRVRSAPFLLTNPDFSKHTIEDKKGSQVERMKRVRIFNPLHVLTNKI
jgi:hypothetical protein